MVELAESVKKRFLESLQQESRCLTSLSATLGAAWLEAAAGESGLFRPDFLAASDSWPYSQSARLCGGVTTKVAGRNPARRRLRVPADVPVLRAHHAAPRRLLPGVRQV